MAVIIGVDPGRAPDRFAICPVEEVTTEAVVDGQRQRRTMYLVRWLERTPLRTSYPRSIARLVEVFDAIAAQTSDEMSVRVDATGVGSPVVDLVRDALATRRAEVVAVTFTGTDRLERASRVEWRVGKAYLVSRLQVLLQQRLVRLPPMPEAKALTRELLDFEIRVSDSAAMQAGAFRTGTHDDLVTALGLTVLEGRRGKESIVSAQGLADANAGLVGGTLFPAEDAAERPLHPNATAIYRDGWEKR